MLESADTITRTAAMNMFYISRRQKKTSNNTPKNKMLSALKGMEKSPSKSYNKTCFACPSYILMQSYWYSLTRLTLMVIAARLTVT